MYVKDMLLDNGAPVKLIYEKPANKEAKDRWEVGFAISDLGFQNISFVNSIATTKGGHHVNVIADQLVKKLEDVVNKKNKGGLKVILGTIIFYPDLKKTVIMTHNYCYKLEETHEFFLLCSIRI